MRDQQTDFYQHSEAVKDPVLRSQKANKIAYILKRYGDASYSGAVALDLGCSSGLMTGRLAPLFDRMVGLDYDIVALNAIAPADKLAAQFMRGDGMALPFRDESLDVIICAQTYEHVPVAERMFVEMYRVLKKGGLVFFSGPNWLYPLEPHYHLPLLHWLPSSLADRYLRLLGRGTKYYERSFSYWQLRRLFRHFDVEIVTLRVVSEVLLTDRSFSRGLVEVLDRLAGPLLEPILPNFNWILRKRCVEEVASI